MLYTNRTKIIRWLEWFWDVVESAPKVDAHIVLISVGCIDSSESFKEIAVDKRFT